MVKEDLMQKPKYYFRQWRKHRQFSQETLAERVGLTASSISQLETGKQGFTDSTLAALADAMQCHPGELLLCDPTDPDSLWCLFKPAEDSAPATRKRIARVVEVILSEA